MRKRLLRGLQPNVMRLDDLYVLASSIAGDTSTVTLCRKPNGLGERIVLELGLARGVVVGTATIDGGKRIAIPTACRGVLTQLWRALQSQIASAAQRPCSLKTFIFEGDTTRSPEPVFAGFERALEHYGPVIKNILEHSPDPSELVVKLSRPDGSIEELYVLRQDLAQHLLALPPSMQKRLAPRELLGDAAALIESDLIDLGVIVHPDAGEDSAVIALHDVAAPAMDATIDEAFHELITDDMIISDDEGPVPLPEDEVSGCYDLDQLMSKPPGAVGSRASLG